MRSRFVEDQDPGIAQETSRDGDALALTAREFYPRSPICDK